MAINQLSTSNTFQQWLSATQTLIEKSNYFETTTNTVFSTANTVYQTANNISNTANAFYLYNTNAYLQSNAAFAQANSALAISIQANAASIIAFTASNNAYSAANAALAYANSASITSNTAFGIANAAFSHANAAFNFANTANAYANAAFTTSNLAYTYSNTAIINVNNTANSAQTSINLRANSAISNVSNAAANALAVVASANTIINAATIQIQTSYAAANLFLGYVANNSNLALLTNDITTDNNLRYILFVDTVPLSNNGVLTQTFVSNTKLYYNPGTGTLNATNFNSLSDSKFKKDVIYIENAVNTIRNVDGVGFTWVDSGQKSYGVIAQELEKILPELIDGTEQKSVNYSGLIAFLINAVKELDNRLSELENIINKQ
jgi:hypothetical protein